MKYLRVLWPKLPSLPEPPESDIAAQAAYLYPQVAILDNISAYFVPSLATEGQLVLIKISVILLVYQRDVLSFGSDLNAIGMVVCHDVGLHNPIRLMPVPPALQWNLKISKTVPVDVRNDLIVAISVCRRCHRTTACPAQRSRPVRIAIFTLRSTRN